MKPVSLHPLCQGTTGRFLSPVSAGTSMVFVQRRDQQDRGMSTQDLFVQRYRRRGEVCLGISLRRHSRVGVVRTGDDHNLLGKRVLGAAHLAGGVTVSNVPNS